MSKYRNFWPKIIGINLAILLVEKQVSGDTRIVGTGTSRLIMKKVDENGLEMFDVR